MSLLIVITYAHTHIVATHSEVKELEKAYDTLRREYDKTSKVCM